MGKITAKQGHIPAVHCISFMSQPRSFISEIFTCASRADISHDPEVFLFHEVSANISAGNKRSRMCRGIYNHLIGLSFMFFFFFLLRASIGSCLPEFIKHITWGGHAGER